MSMSNSVPVPAAGFVCPEIGASDLKAARDFLTSFRDGPSPASPAPRPLNRPGDRKPPAVSNGIARARLRHKANS
jgi:hypothetical protein